MSQIKAAIYKTPEAVERLVKQKKFDDEARQVAVLMCEEMGLDPYEVVLVEPGFASLKWEEYFEHAQRALAGWRAVHRWALTQAD